jgi:hypothetical protein
VTIYEYYANRTHKEITLQHVQLQNTKTLVTTATNCKKKSTILSTENLQHAA